MHYAFVLFLVLLTSGGVLGFSDHFNKWLVRRYGQKTADLLFLRPELGSSATFGGRQKPGDKLSHQPVLLVHGMGDGAARLAPMQQAYFNAGYRPSEVYGATWAMPLHTAITPARCLYIKRVREWVKALSAYSQSKIDVIAHSMGVPLTRKAIIGGVCLDTGEQLGKPLTHLVDTFVGVGGANLGLPLCLLGGKDTSCDRRIGLFPGSGASKCDVGPSVFLKQLREQPAGLEGSRTYTIWSKGDIVIPYKMCGHQLASAIPGQTGQAVYRHLGHWGVMMDTVDKQIELIRPKVVINPDTPRSISEMLTIWKHYRGAAN